MGQNVVSVVVMLIFLAPLFPLHRHKHAQSSTIHYTSTYHTSTATAKLPPIHHTPLPVTVHGPVQLTTAAPIPVQLVHAHPGLLEIGTFLVALVAALAAIAALVQLTSKSRLKASFPNVQPSPIFGAGLLVSCNVVNSGRRGLRDFRVTYAFSPGWSIDQQRHDATSSNYMASFGTQIIDGATWSTVEFTAGPIYAPDDLSIATIAIKGAPNAACQVRWHIDSEDGRVPLHGWSEPVTLTFAALSAASPRAAASAGS